MPTGYQVVLGDGSLDAGDSIVDPTVTFTTDTTLGAGEWTWSGTFGGTTYTNELEPGVYYLATDGNVYFVPDYGVVDTITSSEVTSAPAYSSNDGVITGDATDDLIDSTFTDEDGEVVDGGDGTGTLGHEDVIHGYDGDDTIASGAEDDTVYGDAGSDSIDGGTGDDVIYGDFGGTGPTSTSESLDWSAEGIDGTDLSSGFTQTTGGMDVSVTFTSDGDNLPEYLVETTDTVYVGGGEPFDPNSSLLLLGDGDGPTSTTTIDFAATTGSGFTDEVQNVSFRINDIDWGAANHTDIVTINAYDADGNPVAVSITVGGGDTVSGNTITAEELAENFDELGGSALIEIAGPVNSIEITYANGQTVTQGIWVTDVHFETIVEPALEGDDSIDGGLGDDLIFGEGGDDSLTGSSGADTMHGGAGDDTLILGAGDSVTGGDGDDLFVLDPTDALDGSGGTITIVGGEGDETLGDTLDFSGLIPFGGITYTNTNDAAGGLSGTATLADGTVVDFSEIENIIICFTKGTPILTPQGERMVQDLRPGDMVLTRDHGPQPLRWIGNRSVAGKGKLAPVRFAPGTLGNSQPLLVSPQHRMVYTGPDAVLYFEQSEVMAAAKHLVNGTTITQSDVESVTYYHMLFDTHEVVYASGAASESFHPGNQGLKAIDVAQREELFTLFPELRSDLGSYGDTARTVLRGYEAKLLNPNQPSDTQSSQVA